MSYNTKAVWVGTILGDNTSKDLEDYFLKETGYHIKYIEEFTLLDSDINCIIFGVCAEEIPKFSTYRVQTKDIKWLDDFLVNERERIPLEILNKYGMD